MVKQGRQLEGEKKKGKSNTYLQKLEANITIYWRNKREHYNNGNLNFNNRISQKQSMLCYEQ